MFTEKNKSKHPTEKFEHPTENAERKAASLSGLEDAMPCLSKWLRPPWPLLLSPCSQMYGSMRSFSAKEEKSG